MSGIVVVMECGAVVAKAQLALQEAEGVLEADDLALLDEVIERVKAARDLLSRSGCAAGQLPAGMARALSALERRRREVLEEFKRGLAGLSPFEVVDYLYRASRSSRDLALRLAAVFQFYTNPCMVRVMGPRLVATVRSVPEYAGEEEFRNVLTWVVQCVAEGRFSAEGLARVASLLGSGLGFEELGVLRQHACVLFFLGYVELASSIIKLAEAPPEGMEAFVKNLNERYGAQFRVISGELKELSLLLSRC
jgi:hypothetical protein